MTTTTDVRDRRHNNMQTVLDALEGCSNDLVAFPADAGVAYLVADRIERLRTQLASFQARDLLTTRKASA